MLWKMAAGKNPMNQAKNKLISRWLRQQVICCFLTRFLLRRTNRKNKNADRTNPIKSSGRSPFSHKSIPQLYQERKKKSITPPIMRIRHLGNHGIAMLFFPSIRPFITHTAKIIQGMISDQCFVQNGMISRRYSLKITDHLFQDKII